MTIRAHARLAPSSASRWLYCAASVGFIEDEELADEGGIAADNGSILHAFCEHVLKTGVSPYALIGEIGEYNGTTLELTEEHADKIQEGIDRLDEMPGKMLIERRLDLGYWMPGQFGTMDVGIIGKKRATLFDWKWGYIPVFAVDNDQLRIYALGFWDNYLRVQHPHIKRFRLIIWQPFAPGGGGEWDVTLDELLDWGDELREKAKLTYKKDAPFVPGKKQCEYCPGAKNLVCEAYNKFVKEMIVRDMDRAETEIERGLPMRLSSEEISPELRSHIILHRSMINKFLDRLEAEALDDAKKGRKVPLMKAVKGRSPARKWKDKEAAEIGVSLVLTEDQAYQKKLVSPTQIEKLLPENLYKRIENEYVDLGEKKTILVPEGDARPPVPTYADEFDL